jgi:hypothetical protein
MEHRIQETTLTNVSGAEVLTSAPAQQQVNNNNKFHAVNHQNIEHQFAKKLAVDIQFTDICYKTTVWSMERLRPGE